MIVIDSTTGAAIAGSDFAAATAAPPPSTAANLPKKPRLVVAMAEDGSARGRPGIEFAPQMTQRYRDVMLDLETYGTGRDALHQAKVAVECQKVLLGRAGQPQ